MLVHLHETHKSPSFHVAKWSADQVDEPSWFGGAFIMTSQKKKCSRCGKTKSTFEFHKNRTTADGLQAECVVCVSKRGLNYKRSKSGVVSRLCSAVFTRADKLYNHKPDFSRRWLKDWIVQQPLFHELYDNWVESKYNIMKSVSVDRVDDHGGYTKCNIQLMTWKENQVKSWNDLKSGKTTKKCKSVVRTSEDGIAVTTFASMSLASRKTGMSKSSIFNYCKSGKNDASGCTWNYANES